MNIQLTHCLLCNCPKDRAKEIGCSLYKKHQFHISEKQSKKYNQDIKWIKEELETGRDISATLGSYGYIYQDEIMFLANYCSGIGESKMYFLIINNNK